MANDEAKAFEEIYKGRIIEALRRGNDKRPWWAIVDGRRASPSRGTTSTFTSPRLALECARDMIDNQIAELSQLRIANPGMAVALSRLDVEEAEKVFRHVSKPGSSKRDALTMKRADALLTRVRRDLALAEAALAQKQEKLG